VLRFFLAHTLSADGARPEHPAWVRHLALEVDSMERCWPPDRGRRHQRPSARPTTPSSDGIYFFDPNGHRVRHPVNTSAPEAATEKSSTTSKVGHAAQRMGEHAKTPSTAWLPPLTPKKKQLQGSP
jgi:hypothetical protein